MLPDLSAAVTGLNADQNEMTVVANNLANQSTPGFKEAEGDFASLLSQTYNAGTAPNAAGTQGGVNPYQLGMGVELAGTSIDQSQGGISQTGNPLDFAIQGNGFFEVSGTQGTFLTRDGQFSLDSEGNLVSAVNGDIVQGYSAVTTKMNYATTPPTPATVSPTMGTTVTGLNIPQEINQGGTTYTLSSWSVGQNGTIVGVYTDNTGATTTVNLGQILLATVANPSGLVASGQSMFQTGPNSGPAITGVPGTNGAGTVIQGAIENSNTDVVTQMAQLVQDNGAYDTNAKVVTVSQQMMTALANMVQ